MKKTRPAPSLEPAGATLRIQVVDVLESARGYAGLGLRIRRRSRAGAVVELPSGIEIHLRRAPKTCTAGA